MLFKVPFNKTSLCFCEMSLQSFSDHGESFVFLAVFMFIPS